MTHSTCHVITIIRNHAKTRKLFVVSISCSRSKSCIIKCHNLITGTDMKSPLVLFDVAMSKLSTDIENMIFHQMHEYDPFRVDRHVSSMYVLE